MGRKSNASSADTVNEHNGWNAGNWNAQQGIGVTRSSESALVVINVPFALDYCQVVMALSHVIRQLYVRLGLLILGARDGRPRSPSEKPEVRSIEAHASWPASLTELITKADRKLKVSDCVILVGIRADGSDRCAEYPTLYRSRNGADRPNRRQSSAGNAHAQSQRDRCASGASILAGEKSP